MRIEKRLDENGKVELVVHQDSEELYTELKGFRKVFLPLLGEHKVIRQSEHVFMFQIPEFYGQDKVIILFHSDLALFGVSGKCVYVLLKKKKSLAFKICKSLSRLIFKTPYEQKVT